MKGRLVNRRMRYRSILSSRARESVCVNGSDSPAVVLISIGLCLGVCYIDRYIIYYIYFLSHTVPFWSIVCRVGASETRSDNRGKNAPHTIIHMCVAVLGKLVSIIYNIKSWQRYHRTVIINASSIFHPYT